MIASAARYTGLSRTPTTFRSMRVPRRSAFLLAVAILAAGLVATVVARGGRDVSTAQRRSAGAGSSASRARRSRRDSG